MLEKLAQTVLNEGASYFLAIKPAAEAMEPMPFFYSPNNAHITMVFLGKKTPEQIDQLKKKLFEISSDISSFNVYTSGYGTFNSQYPHVKIEKTKPLMNLYNTLNTQLKGFVNMQQKNFVPHVTLSRTPLSGVSPELPNTDFEAKSVVLYKSKKGNELYIPIAQFPLKSRNIFEKAVDYFKELKYALF